MMNYKKLRKYIAITTVVVMVILKAITMFGVENKVLEEALEISLIIGLVAVFINASYLNAEK